MAKMKYTVPTIIGNVTRTGNGHYSHVVVMKGYTLAWMTAQNEQGIASAKKYLTDLLADRASDFMNSYNKQAANVGRHYSGGVNSPEAKEAAADSRNWARKGSDEYIAEARKDLAQYSPANFAKSVAASKNSTDHAFAGRLDLAKKTAAKFTEYGAAEVEIVEIKPSMKREVVARAKKEKLS
jgi:hypothetical protein